MKTLKNDWLIWVIILTPFLFVAYFWKQFPEQVPTHFGFDGSPDAYSDKVTGLLIFPGINILMYFLFIALPKIDPSKKGQIFYQDKSKFAIVRTLLHALLSFILMTVIFFSLGYNFNMTFAIFYGLAAFFLVMGNYMGNVRHNYFVGVRTPWTLANETVWTSTHRLTAKLWVASSLLIMLAFPFLPNNIGAVAFEIYLAVIILVPIVYSYLEFRKLQGKAEH
ncbi:SdpI family protein [soil metagenome]